MIKSLVQLIVVNHRQKLNANNLIQTSLGSPIPSAFIENKVSDSGRHGESYILHILVSPRPFLKYKRVVEACLS